MLSLTAELDAKLRQAVEDFDFNSYVRALTDFCNEDLSAFYFDIRKDCLYCDALDDPKRRAYRTVLDTLFHALVRWLAPVLVFTSEEVWGTRYPEGGSVHLLEWPELPPVAASDARWAELRELRTQVTEAIEPLRRDKVIGSSLEAEVTLPEADLATRPRRAVHRLVSGARRCVGGGQDRPPQMRSLLASSSRGRRGRRPVQPLRGCGEWLTDALPMPSPPWCSASTS